MNPFPTSLTIEDIELAAFDSPDSLFHRIIHEIRRPKQSILSYLNVHVANQAVQDRRLKLLLQDADCVYCDGAGIKLGAKMLGKHIPTRLTAADWFLEMLATLSEAKCSVYILGGMPGVPEKMMDVLREKLPAHSVMGMHHGFILKDKALEAKVIDEINTLKPDLLIVGFGTPLQEYWMDDHKHELDVPAILPLGAVMDYFTGELKRCPDWMGKAGLEWLYRFYAEPRRLFQRYVVGNPWFLSRIAYTAIKDTVFRKRQKPIPTS